VGILGFHLRITVGGAFLSRGGRGGRGGRGSKKNREELSNFAAARE